MKQNIDIAGIALLGFLGILGALGFIPGWQCLFGFTGFSGCFGFVGVAHINLIGNPSRTNVETALGQFLP
jgi:hypothetical protein